MTDYFHLNANRDTLMNLSSLGLAHLGDSVYEVMVRSWLCLHGKARAADLHKATVKYVAAPAQARRPSIERARACQRPRSERHMRGLASGPFSEKRSRAPFRAGYSRQKSLSCWQASPPA